jgi:pyridoxine 5-phosphate synthase
MKTRPKLSVNLNKVATLRNTRTSGIPSVTHAARLCLDAGADGITVHPRPDERHIRPEDVRALAALLSGYPRAELNIEGNPFHGLIPHVEAVRPAQATLVPDDPGAFTSNRGWDLEADAARLEPIVGRLRLGGCRVSLFMDAGSAHLARAAAIGADRIELYTEPYALAFAEGRADEVIPRFAEAAQRAQEAGLGVNAGHDLNLQNLPRFVAQVPGLAETSIGHALVADALEYGLPETVRRYLAALS